MISRTVRQMARRDAAIAEERRRGLPGAGASLRLSSARSVEIGIAGVHRLPIAPGDEITVQAEDGSLLPIDGWTAETGS